MGVVLEEGGGGNPEADSCDDFGKKGISADCLGTPPTDPTHRERPVVRLLREATRYDRQPVARVDARPQCDSVKGCQITDFIEHAGNRLGQYRTLFEYFRILRSPPVERGTAAFDSEVHPVSVSKSRAGSQC